MGWVPLAACTPVLSEETRQCFSKKKKDVRHREVAEKTEERTLQHFPQT